MLFDQRLVGMSEQDYVGIREFVAQDGRCRHPELVAMQRHGHSAVAIEPNHTRAPVPDIKTIRIPIGGRNRSDQRQLIENFRRANVATV
jgi:hypothetical protein